MLPFCTYIIKRCKFGNRLLDLFAVLKLINVIVTVAAITPAFIFLINVRFLIAFIPVYDYNKCRNFAKSVKNQHLCLPNNRHLIKIIRCKLLSEKVP